MQLPFFPVGASTQAPQTDLLFATLVAIATFFTVIVLVLIILFSVRYRRGKQADRSNPPHGNTKMEIGWIAGLLILSVGTYSWATFQYFRITAQPANALEIYVTGKQWMWKFQHPEGPREIDALHVPVGQPVRLIMTSEDVIHSLFVPAFRLKYDVVPGRYTNLWFTATKVGEYPIRCTQYCGTLHSQMIGTVYVMEPQAYAAWLSSGGAGQANLPPAQQGQQLLTQLGCNTCHTGQPGALGPNLNGLFGSQVPIQGDGSVTADENYIRESILFPERKIVQGYQPVMPSFSGRVTEDQLIAIVAYIKSLATPGTGSNPAPAGSPATSPAPAGTPATTQAAP